MVNLNYYEHPGHQHWEFPMYMTIYMTFYSTQTCSVTFNAKLLTISKIQKQIVFQQSNEQWNYHAYILRNAIQVLKNEIRKYTGKWIEVENIILNQVTKSKEDNCQMFSHLLILPPKSQKQVYNMEKTYKPGKYKQTIGGRSIEGKQ